MMKTPSAIKTCWMEEGSSGQKKPHPLDGTLGAGRLASCCTTQRMFSSSQCNDAFFCWADVDGPAH
eukprot:1200653-Ditylum_brightwellii.AAC.1